MDMEDFLWHKIILQLVTMANQNHILLYFDNVTQLGNNPKSWWISLNSFLTCYSRTIQSFSTLFLLFHKNINRCTRVTSPYYIVCHCPLVLSSNFYWFYKLLAETAHCVNKYAEELGSSKSRLRFLNQSLFPRHSFNFANRYDRVLLVSRSLR